MNHGFQSKVLDKKFFTDQKSTYLCCFPLTQQQTFILSAPIFNTNRQKIHKRLPYNDIIHCKFHHKFLIETQKIITNNNQPKRNFQEYVQGILSGKLVRTVSLNFYTWFNFQLSMLPQIYCRPWKNN